MKPSLVVLAAGMGSRYGGLKQIDSFGPNGETILDYSIYDAIDAGFGKVVFIIRESFYDDFKAFFAGKFEDKIEVVFVFQEMNILPPGVKYTGERQKPWGTAHAVYVAKDVVNEAFAVINADDYYGRGAYLTLAKYFKSEASKQNYALVAYELERTMSDHGTVNRGVCSANQDNELIGIKECLKIGFDKDRYISYPAADGTSIFLDKNAPVSMNFWGFTPDYFEHCELSFRRFIERHGDNPKAEYFIPILIEELIQSGEKKVEILNCQEEWFGVTYKEDKPIVEKKIAQLIKTGVYPDKLWN